MWIDHAEIDDQHHSDPEQEHEAEEGEQFAAGRHRRNGSGRWLRSERLLGGGGFFAAHIDCLDSDRVQSTGGGVPSQGERLSGAGGIFAFNECISIMPRSLGH